MPGVKVQSKTSSYMYQRDALKWDDRRSTLNDRTIFSYFNKSLIFLVRVGINIYCQREKKYFI